MVRSDTESMARQLHSRDRDRQALPEQFGHRRRRSDRCWDGQRPAPAFLPQARSAASTAGPASKNRGYRVTTNAATISKANSSTVPSQRTASPACRQQHSRWPGDRDPRNWGNSNSTEHTRNAPDGSEPVKDVPGHDISQGQSWRSCHCARMQTCLRDSTKSANYRSAQLKARADRQSIQQQSDESSSADETVVELQLQ